MSIAFMEVADKWNAFKATNPISPNITKVKRCHDKGKVIIILPFEFKNEAVHITCQADSDNYFTAFHITEEVAEIFEAGPKKAGKKVVGRGGKKRYYNFMVSGAGVARTVTFSATSKIYDHDKSKDVAVVSDTIKSGAERDILALLRAFILFADP